MGTDWRAIATELAVALRHSTPNAGFKDAALGALKAYAAAWAKEAEPGRG